MPASNGPLPPRRPAPLPEELAAFVREAAQAAFGEDAVVRSYGEDAARLELHVECSAKPPFGQAEMIGRLLTRLDHLPTVEVTRRGSRVTGKARIAYREGQII